MRDPLFSIIIPTYNRANFIVKTIESILKQKYSNFEIIIIDDGSTDNTSEVIKRIGSSKIKYYSKKNEERAIARNYGISKALGDYISFIDSDDIMYENCLLDASKFISSNPNCNIFYNPYELINAKGQIIHSHQWKLSGNDLKNISTGNFLACIGVFISKNIYSTFKFDENPILIGTEDWDFWLRILAQEKTIKKIDVINSAMIEHTNRSMNNVNLDQLIKRRLYIIDKIKNDSQLLKIYNPYLKILISSSYLFIASNATSSNKQTAKKYLKKALKINPNYFFNIRTFIVLRNILLK